MSTHSRVKFIRVLLLVVAVSTLSIFSTPAASAASPTCQSIVAGKASDLPPDTPFNGGIPFRITIGADVDFSPEAGGVFVDATTQGASDFFPLSPGLNDILIQAGATGTTLVEWSIPLTDGSRCTGQTEARVIVPADQPHVSFRTPTWGQVFTKGQKVLPQFDCGDNGYHVSYCTVNGIGTWNDGPMPNPNPHPELDTSTPGRHWVVGFAQDQPNTCDCAKFGYTTQLYYVDAGAAAEPLTYDVTLQQRSYPQGDWVNIDPSEPVVAGNVVRAVIDISNNSDIPQRVQANATVERTTVSDSTFDVTVPAHESHSHAMKIETTDLAWNTWDNSPHLNPINLRLQTVTKDKVDVTNYAFTVRPRPLILVHGWKSYAQSSWGKYQDILTAAHPLLKGYAVGDGQFPGTMNTNGGGTGDSTARTGTVAENAAQEALYIEGVRRATNAWQVDVLAHSMGGLISRYYLQELMPLEGQKPAVNRLIQMGTPNRGSQLADMMMAFGAGGSTTTIPFYPASMHLTTSWVDGVFNPRVTETHGVPISNLVGTNLPLLMVPLLPHLYGDGIVPAYSARWTLSDTQDSPYDFHTAMTESVDDFYNYVLPRLVRPSTAPALTTSDEHPAGAADDESTADASVEAPTPDLGSQVRDVKKVRVPADGSIELPFEIEDSPATGALTASTNLVLEIIDADGQVVARSQDPGSKDDGRAVLVAEAYGRPASPATLRITDNGGQARDVEVLSYVGGSSLALQPAVAPALGMAASSGTASVTARFTHGDDAVTDATVAARLTDAPAVGHFELRDDGLHADGRAGDGTYGALVADVPPGDHVAVVRATSPVGSRIAATVVSVGPDGQIPGPISGEPMHTLSVESDPGGHVDISPEKELYAEGEVVTLRPVPAPGQRSAGWTVDNITRPPGDLLLTIRADRAVVAHFEPDIPTTPPPDPGGDPDGDPGGQPTPPPPTKHTAPALTTSTPDRPVRAVLGKPFNHSISIVDPDASDTWTATADYGHGPMPARVAGTQIPLIVQTNRIGHTRIRIVVTDSTALSAAMSLDVEVVAGPEAARQVLAKFDRRAGDLDRRLRNKLRQDLVSASRAARRGLAAPTHAQLDHYGRLVRRAQKRRQLEPSVARRLASVAIYASRALTGQSAR